MSTLNVQEIDGDSEPESKLSEAQASSAIPNVLPTPIATLAPTPPSLSNDSATPSSPPNATTILPRAGIDPSLPVTPSSAPAVPLPIKSAHARDLPVAASMPTPAPSIPAVAPSSLPVTPPASVSVPGSLAPANGVPVPVTAANADPDSGEESDDESGDESSDEDDAKTTPSSTPA
jgi:hypothetical protein